MNTSKNLAKHTYELLLSAINILVTFYCYIVKICISNMSLPS